MDFRLVYWDAYELRNLLSVVAVVCEEPTLHLSREGLLIREMDPSRIMLIELRLDYSAFDELEAPNGEHRVFLNLKEFLKHTKGIPRPKYRRRGPTTGRTRAELVFDGGRLHVKLTGAVEREMTFSIAPSTCDPEPIPNTCKIDYPATVGVDTRALQKAVKGAYEVAMTDWRSRTLVFEATREKLVVSAQGSEGLSFSAVFRPESDDVLFFSVKKKARALFSADVLRKMLTAAKKVSDWVALNLRTDSPLRMDFNLPALPGKMRFWLAHCLPPED